MTAKKPTTPLAVPFTKSKHKGLDTSEYCVSTEAGLRCACSSQETTKVGTGTTTRTHLKRIFWYVEQIEEDEFGMWTVNDKYVPVGKRTTLSMEEMLRQYQPEVEFYQKKIAPAMRELSKTIAKGDRHRSNGEPFSAEMEYKHALRVDEENVRATFGLGLLYLEHGEMEKGTNVFNSLIKLEETFAPKHKHLFNEFGIKLRKNGLYDEAAAYYGQALSLSPGDTNLHFNLARCQFEKGDLAPCALHIASFMEGGSINTDAKGFCHHVFKAIRTLSEAGLTENKGLAGTDPTALAHHLSKALKKSGDERKEHLKKAVAMVNASPPATAPPKDVSVNKNKYLKLPNID